MIEKVDEAGNAVGHTPHYIEVYLPFREGDIWTSRQFVQVVLDERHIRI